MLHDLVRYARSYRGFDETYRFTANQLRSLVDLARLTASAANRQPLKYHLVWERDEAERVLVLTKWAAALPQLHLPEDGKHPTAFIVILQDTSIVSTVGAADKDVGISAQTIMLGAAEQGLGGCMIANFSKAEMQKELALPEHLIPVLVLALGKPSEHVEIVETPRNGSTTYYRNNGIHYVPKRQLDDMIV